MACSKIAKKRAWKKTASGASGVEAEARAVVGFAALSFASMTTTSARSRLSLAFVCCFSGGRRATVKTLSALVCCAGEPPRRRICFASIP
jgi:hypothetical protein